MEHVNYALLTREVKNKLEARKLRVYVKRTLENRPKNSPSPAELILGLLCLKEELFVGAYKGRFQ